MSMPGKARGALVVQGEMWTKEVAQDISWWAVVLEDGQRGDWLQRRPRLLYMHLSCYITVGTNRGSSLPPAPLWQPGTKYLFFIYVSGSQGFCFRALGKQRNWIYFILNGQGHFSRIESNQERGGGYLDNILREEVNINHWKFSFPQKWKSFVGILGWVELFLLLTKHHESVRRW